MIEVLRILTAPLLWLASFSAIYALHGLGCALRWPEVEIAGLTLFRLLLLAAWCVGILAQAGLLLALHSERFGSAFTFIRWTSIATACVAITATLWTLAPVAVTSACGTNG